MNRARTLRDGKPYRGRFAPSPTGPLHMGSLVAAMGSYLEARSRDGEWWVRVEDVDRPRSLPGTDRLILETLDCFGMERDGPVIYQRDRTDFYHDHLERLLRDGQAFHCACSRRELDGPVYPGTCRAGVPAGRSARSVRARACDAIITFEDRLQGRVSQDLNREVGDFIILRGDGLIAYQLAVVADDADQGITAVVRGRDLLDSTPRQIHLQRRLGLPTPEYAHLPVVLNRQGHKLSKQTGAEALDLDRPVSLLYRSLVFLGQRPPADLARSGLQEFWDWAIANWRLDRVPPAQQAATDDGASVSHVTAQGVTGEKKR